MPQLVGKTISRAEAVKIGAYPDATAMEMDLQRKEHATKNGHTK